MSLPITSHLLAKFWGKICYFNWILMVFINMRSSTLHCLSTHMVLMYFIYSTSLQQTLCSCTLVANNLSSTWRLWFSILIIYNNHRDAQSCLLVTFSSLLPSLPLPSLSCVLDHDLKYHSTPIFLPDTDTVNMTRFNQNNTWYCRYGEMRWPINGRYCQFRYQILISRFQTLF